MRRMPGRPRSRTLLRLLGRRLPRTRGTVRVGGICGTVTIGRDRWGIPHVDASSELDAWFGLGFCHGQDRGFQLEILARAVRGRLAEILGPGAVGIDRMSRTLGFRRVALEQRPLLDDDVVATLAAYVSGINAGRRLTPRPHELVLLRAPSLAWEIEDVLGFIGLQSLALAANWDSELARLAILLADGADALRAVDETPVPWLPVVDPPGTPAGEPLDRLAADLAALRSLVGAGDGGASNAWALAPSRTTTGAPILANDPHLGADVPAPWYLVHLRTPTWEVAGASFVGGPVVPSGHNGRCAWGITAGSTDSADLFWEEIASDGRARGPNGPEPVTRLREEIAVRGRRPVVEEVTVTRRGPVVTPLLEGIGLALSLSATWLRPAPVRGLLDLVRATDVASFRSPFAAWPGPALNVVYADRDGHIGWQLIGTLPRRAAGNGTLPRPAWEPGWEDEPLAFDAMPHAFDPPAGYLVSANNAPRVDAPDAPFLGVDWLDAYRAAAIDERLASEAAWDVAATAALQTDVTSIPWREMRDAVLGVAPTSGAETLALALLRDWDGRVAAGSAAASVFELLVAELSVATTREAAPNGWGWAMGAGFGDVFGRTSFGARSVGRLSRMLRRDGSHDDAIRAALRTAVDTLTAARGPDPNRWAWGDVRPLRLRHTLGAARALAPLLNLGPARVGGDTNTVAQAGVRATDPLGPHGAIPNHRMVVDLADPDRSRYVLAGGQSGNPLSPHYGDLFALWVCGEGVAIAWSPERVEAAVVDRLTLAPRSLDRPAGDGARLSGRR